MAPKILRLTLKKEWFDLITSGAKRFEYREYKDHWISRLTKKIWNDQFLSFKEFDEIHFTNGYGHDKPFMRLAYKGICIAEGSQLFTEHNEPINPDGYYFVIELGSVLEVKNND